MFRVVALGTIVPDPHFVSTKLGQNYFLPDGFSIDRSVFQVTNAEDKNSNTGGGSKKTRRQLPVEVNTSVSDRSEGHPSGLYFTATMSAKPPQKDGDATDAKKPKNGPLYTITRSDAPTEKRYEGENSASVWLQAIAESEKDFADRVDQLLLRSPGTEKSTIHGLELFGVYFPDVVKAVAGLSGAAEAAAAIPVKPRKTNEKTATTEKKGKKSASPAKHDESGLLSDLVVDVSSSPQPTTKNRKKRSTSGDGKKAPTTTSAEGGEGTATTAPKRSRKSAAKAAAGAATLACPDCGLVNTPFCAATGKPHVASVCPKCGLSSAFCPVTGEAHTGVAQRENRQRGEVHLPGAKRSRKTKTPATAAGAAAGAADAAGEVHEVTVVSTQQTPTPTGEAPKKRRRSRAKAATATAEGGEAVEVLAGENAEAGEGAPAKKRRTRSTKKTDATAVPAPDGAAAAARAEATAVSAPPPLPEPPAPEEPKEYEYPPLRPPMSSHESSKALHIMHKALREQADQQYLPPCVAALRMPFISVRIKSGNNTTRKRPHKGKGSKENDNVKQEEKELDGNANEDRDDTATSATNNPKDENAGEDNKEGAVDNEDEAQQNKADESKGAATTILSVHPLVVRDLGTSFAGKRYMKFMSQYTSERTKLDAIRKNSTSAAPKRPQQKTSAPEAAREGAEEEQAEKKVADGTVGLVDRSDDISTVQLSAVKLEERPSTPPHPPGEMAQPEEEEGAEDIAATQIIS